MAPPPDCRLLQVCRLVLALSVLHLCVQIRRRCRGKDRRRCQTSRISAGTEEEVCTEEEEGVPLRQEGLDPQEEVRWEKPKPTMFVRESPPSDDGLHVCFQGSSRVFQAMVMEEEEEDFPAVTQPVWEEA